jgi:hypothetical protein
MICEPLAKVEVKELWIRAMKPSDLLKRQHQKSCNVQELRCLTAK